MKAESEFELFLNELTLDYARELDKEEEKKREEAKRKKEEGTILEQLESQFEEMIVPGTTQTEEEFRHQFIGVETPEGVEVRPRITRAEENFRQRFIGGE